MTIHPDWNQWADALELAVRESIEKANAALQHSQSAHHDIRKLMGRISELEAEIRRLTSNRAA